MDGMGERIEPMASPSVDIGSDQVEHWADMLAQIAVEGGADPAETPTRARQARWLTSFCDTWSAPEACRLAGLRPSTVWAWQRDDVFRHARELAEEVMRETAKGEAWRRAIHGVERGIWHRGELVGTERVYSDALLSMVLKRTDPEGWSGEPKRAAQGDEPSRDLVARILKDQTAMDAWRVVVERLGLPESTEPQVSEAKASEARASE